MLNMITRNGRDTRGPASVEAAVTLALFLIALAVPLCSPTLACAMLCCDAPADPGANHAKMPAMGCDDPGQCTVGLAGPAPEQTTAAASQVPQVLSAAGPRPWHAPFLSRDFEPSPVDAPSVRHPLHILNGVFLI